MTNDDKIIRERVRKRLIQCRTDYQLTQAEIGKTIGKSTHAVSSWEQGLSLPDIVTLYRLAAYYEKTLEYMMGGDDNGDS